MDATRGALRRARDAVARGAWPEAHEAFGRLDPAELGPRDLEDYAEAAWWTSRLRESIELRHKAYGAYVSDGDERNAGAVAARLAIEHFIHDEPSVGSGFLQLAHRHATAALDDLVDGFLAVVDATVARFTGQPERAIELSRRGVEIARRIRDRDLVAMSVHVEGLASIEAGAVAEGLGLVDEAMALVVAGDVSPYFTGIVYCNVIGACLGIGDLRRAGEWSDAAQAWLETISTGSPFPGMCRVNRAEVARLRGALADAETEALLACRELEGLDPDLTATAFAQLGEARRRRGDLAGATAAFERAAELGGDPQPGLALARLAQGRRDTAMAGLRLALAVDTPFSQRARLLAAEVEVAIALGHHEEAAAAADDLATLGRRAPSPWLDASVAFAQGLVALEAGDALTAMRRLREAAVAWNEQRLPYEAAHARMRLGEALRTAGDEDGAGLELRAAAATFRRLGARRDADEADRQLQGSERPSGLSPREIEVLRLVAAGKTNRDIAVELVISQHTVGRHLQNIYAKIGVSTRAGATAFAFEHDLA